jgi:hypothetical protein
LLLFCAQQKKGWGFNADKTNGGISTVKVFTYHRLLISLVTIDLLFKMLDFRTLFIWLFEIVTVALITVKRRIDKKVPRLKI